jgi:hypothetical protein
MGRQPEDGETRRRGRAAVSLLILAAAGGSFRAAAQPQDAPPPLAPELRQMLRRSNLVLVGDIGAVSEADDGRLLRARLRIGRTLAGAVDGTGVHDGTGVDIVEDRRFPSARPTLRSGRRVVVFLVVAKQNAQMRRALPPGSYYRVLDEPWGLIDLPDATAEREVVGALEGWIALGRERALSQQERDAAVRRLTFSELEASHPRLSEDAVVNLATLAGLADSLTPSEQDILARALRRTDLPERVRIALIEAIAAARLAALAQSLRDLPGASPALVRASTLARSRLGTGPGQEELSVALREGDPATRAAMVPALLRAQTGGIAAVGALATTDPAREVRLAAIEALGESGSPEALSILGQTFKDADPEIRERSAQAIYRIGGRGAAELAADLAFTAPPEGQRHAVFLLGTLGVGGTDSLVKRIRESHPDPAIRDLATHGLKVEPH